MFDVYSWAVQNWGGGSVCQSEASSGQPAVQLDCRVFNNITGAFDRNTTCFAPPEVSLCSGNGEVELVFGSPEYIGLGAIVFLVLIVLEVFGSPLMRNCEVCMQSHTLASSCQFSCLLLQCVLDIAKLLPVGCAAAAAAAAAVMFAKTEILVHTPSFKPCMP